MPDIDTVAYYLIVGLTAFLCYLAIRYIRGRARAGRRERWAAEEAAREAALRAETAEDDRLEGSPGA